MAAGEGSLGVVALAFKGATEEGEDLLSSFISDHGTTALHEASQSIASTGAETAAFILTEHPGVARRMALHRDSVGQVPLHLASDVHQVETVRYFFFLNSFFKLKNGLS